MYNPNEDKRENDNNMEPIHGHGENEREEKVFSENESHVQESRELEQNVTAEDAKAEEVKNEHPQQTYHSETLRDYTPEDAQPMCFESEAAEKTGSAGNAHQESVREERTEESVHAAGPREERRKQEKK